MFSTKFPAFAALLVLISTAVKDSISALAPGESLAEKVFGYEDMVPELITFLPQAGEIDAEIKAMTPADYAAAAEELVTDFGFTNGHAQQVIIAAFPVVNGLAALEPLVVTLINAIKAGPTLSA